jgi:hypothetical protein
MEGLHMHTVMAMLIVLVLGILLVCRPGMDSGKLVGFVLLLLCIVWCLFVMLLPHVFPLV